MEEIIEFICSLWAGASASCRRRFSGRNCCLTFVRFEGGREDGAAESKLVCGLTRKPSWLPRIVRRNRSPVVVKQPQRLRVPFSIQHPCRTHLAMPPCQPLALLRPVHSRCPLPLVAVASNPQPPPRTQHSTATPRHSYSAWKIRDHCGRLKYLVVFRLVLVKNY